MQMLLREASTTLIQKFNIWEKQWKQTSKKNHQLCWKSWNYYIQLMHNTAEGNSQQKSLQLQNKHQLKKIWRIKLNCWNKTKKNVIRKSNLNILRIRKNIPSQKKQPSGLRLRRPYSNQHRSVKGTEFRTRNNGNTFKLQRTITNALRYKSDPSGNVNLSKHSFSFNTYKLLDKNLNFIPTSKRYIKN